MLLEPNTRRAQSAHVIVVGNEKGGSGKSTTAMHVAIALLSLGQRVATIDLDSREKKLYALYRQPACLGPAVSSRPAGAHAFLRRARFHSQAR
jgi:cellulose biosynthesis protein BcsQ